MLITTTSHRAGLKTLIATAALLLAYVLGIAALFSTFKQSSTQTTSNARK